MGGAGVITLAQFKSDLAKQGVRLNKYRIEHNGDYTLVKVKRDGKLEVYKFKKGVMEARIR